MSAVLCVRWVAYGLLVASAIPLGLSIPQFNRARRAPYYILRRNALRRAMRLLLVMLIMQVLGIVLLIVCPLLQAGSATPTSTPTSAPTAAFAITPSTPEETAIPTITPRPTRAPTATPSPQPTATATSPLSAVPTAPRPDGGPTAPISPVPAGPDARIEFTALAMEKDASGLPVNPSSEFPPGDHAIYVFFTYEGMQNGVERTFAWYKDGEYFERCSQTALWDWGARGRTSYYCHPSTGWEPGDYEIHVFIEDRLQFVAQFVITGPP